MYNYIHIDTLLVDVSVISLLVSPPSFFSTKNEKTFGSPGITRGPRGPSARTEWGLTMGL